MPDNHHIEQYSCLKEPHVQSSKVRLSRFVVLLLTILLGVTAVQGQNGNVIIPSAQGNQNYVLQAGETYTIYDPGGQGNYPADCNITLQFISECGQGITIDGDFDVVGCNTFFLIDQGNGIPGTGTNMNILNTVGWSGHLHYESHGTVLLLFSSSDNTNGSSGFEFTAKACCPSIYNITADQNDNTGILNLNWSDSSDATEWYIIWGLVGSSVQHRDTTYSTHYTLQFLEGDIEVWYSVGSNVVGCQPSYAPRNSIILDCIHSSSTCIDITQKGSCNTLYYWGSLNNSHQHTSRVDNGPDNANSRHTVCTTLRYDPNTNNQLRTIPVGYSASARIGGPLIGGTTEGISYRMHVDTMNHDLLILKYAALMENPNHSFEQQPKFTFSILDSLGYPLSDACFYALFVSNNNLGWNIGQYQWLWKDWTTVGFDLGTFHDQDIYVNLQTYDCVPGGHSSYAYYVLECNQKQIVSSECGDVDTNTFTAPDGFLYRWYKADAPGVTLGTGRSLLVVDSGIYHCECIYTTSTNTSCSFILTAIAGHRWPAAIAGWETAGYDDCNTMVRLLDYSVVSTDEGHNNLTDFPCEETLWRIDNNIETTERNPLVSLAPGQHHVSLYASIGGGDCVDSTSLTINIPPHTFYDTLQVAVCDNELPYTLHDSSFYSAGVYDMVHDCHHIHLIFNINSTYNTDLFDTIAQPMLPYILGDRRFIRPTDGAPVLFSSQEGCDSVVTLHLHIWNNDTVQLDSTVCSNQLPIVWENTTFTHADSISFALQNIHGADSIIILNLNVLPSYIIYDTIVACQGDTTYNNDLESGDYINENLTSLGCDSNTYLHLIIHPVYDNQLYDTICSDHSLMWHDNELTLNGIYLYEDHTSQGCDSNETLHLWVKPAYHNTHSVRICNGSPYTWQDGVTYTESTNLPSIVYNANGCDSVIHLDLIITSNFQAIMEIQPPIVTYDDHEVELRDESGGRSRLWQYMGLTDTAAIVHFAYPMEEDSVLVMLIAVSLHDCTDTAFGLVRADRSVLWAPNAFTPNENQNREFVIKSNELATATVWVYDRGGNLMATFDGLTGSWDGTCKGKACKQAAYVWVMRYTTLAQPRQERTAKGSVLLLR